MLPTPSTGRRTRNPETLNFPCSAKAAITPSATHRVRSVIRIAPNFGSGTDLADAAYVPAGGDAAMLP
jgi:hypothetical protein